MTFHHLRAGLFDRVTCCRRVIQVPLNWVPGSWVPLYNIKGTPRGSLSPKGSKGSFPLLLGLEQPKFVKTNRVQCQLHCFWEALWWVRLGFPLTKEVFRQELVDGQVCKWLGFLLFWSAGISSLTSPHNWGVYSRNTLRYTNKVRWKKSVNNISKDWRRQRENRGKGLLLPQHHRTKTSVSSWLTFLKMH